jgi:ribosome biogenesis protein MAK21
VANFDLIDAYQQHCVKEIYRDFVTNILVDLSKDDIEYYRRLALDILVELMSKKPEIEEVILSLLINKLGDSSKKI